MTSTWIQLAQEALKIPGLLIEIYGDIAKPGVKQVGKALETTLGLGNTILWPITWANERSRIYLERNLEKYREELSSVPEDKVTAVVPELGVPIAEKLAYVSDDKLSSLYIKLLAKASNIDTLSIAHPSFVNVIDNLSPDEAKMLELFKYGVRIPIITALWVNKNDKSFIVKGDFIMPNKYIENIDFPENIDSYTNHLASMGLVVIYRDRAISECTDYKQIEEKCNKLFPVESESDSNLNLKLNRGTLSLSEYGVKFMSACH